MNTDQYLASYRFAANRRYLGILLAQLPVAIMASQLPP